MSLSYLLEVVVTILMSVILGFGLHVIFKPRPAPDRKARR